MTQEALKLALEAMESVTVECNNFHHPKKDQNHHWAKCPPVGRWDKAITAIKEALREHAMREVQRLGQEIEQEPVAWLEPEWGERICPEVGFEATITSDHPRDLCWIPLYPHPPQRTWVGLTDEEIEQIGLSNYIKVVRETEAKLKERNT